MKFNEKTYIDYDPWSGADRDSDMRCHKVKIIKTSKEHDCFLAPLIGKQVHKIKSGDKARVDTALVDGKWGACYSCISCMDLWLINDVGLSESENNKKLNHKQPSVEG